MQTSTQQQFLLGDIEVSVGHNSLKRGDKVVKLQPKAMAVLHFLTVHQNRVVSSQELIERLWVGRVVSQASVQKSINAIRSALSELHPQQDYVQFFSKRGYQLQIEPIFLKEESPAARKDSSSTFSLAQHKKSIVIGVVSLLIVLLALWNWSKLPPTFAKDHVAHFSAWQIYTTQVGSQRTVSLNPNKQHIAYIADALIDAEKEGQSQLLIRDSIGLDWQLALSDGTWLTLAWSPSGNQLAAVEVMRTRGEFPSTDFFAPANFLYRIHFFTLALDQHQLKEKQTLSQWQGRINTISWSDEATLEIVAKQGAGVGNARYHYSVLHQHLSQLEDVAGIANPIASAIHKKTTAIAHADGFETQITLLDEQQNPISQYGLPYGDVEFSWIPDGSGLLVLATDEQQLLLLYRDGKQVPVSLPEDLTGYISRPRYDPTGASIYLAQYQYQADVQWLKPSGEFTSVFQKDRVSVGTLANYPVSLSPNGKQIAYVQSENQMNYVMLWENGKERRATEQGFAAPISDLVWNTEGTEILFNAGSAIYQLGLQGQSAVLLHDVNSMFSIVGLQDDEQQLIFVKTIDDIRNLWTFDLNTHKEKQLTFGSLGATLLNENSIYLQYVNAQGLWKIQDVNNPPTELIAYFPVNSQLLAAEGETMYFLTGGECNESAVLAMPLVGGEPTQYLTRDSELITTMSFHPQYGALQMPCVRSVSEVESHIVLLK